MDDSHLFLQAKREKRWLAFIEVRVSHEKRGALA
jgi:hypothetical protein